MKIINKYKQLRQSIKEDLVTLDNHTVPYSNIYRLHYIDYDKNSKGYVSTQFISVPFRSKYEMNQGEILTVISYIFNYVISMAKVNANSFSATKLASNALKMYPQFGFIPDEEKDENNMIELYVVNGNRKIFKKSKYYDNFFWWYNPSVTYNQVEQIYNKYGVVLDDSCKIKELKKH